MAVLASIRGAPRQPRGAPGGRLQGAVGLAQLHLVAVPRTLGGEPLQLAQARGHVQRRQRAVAHRWHIPLQDGRFGAFLPARARGAEQEPAGRGHPCPEGAAGPLPPRGALRRHPTGGGEPLEDEVGWVGVAAGLREAVGSAPARCCGAGLGTAWGWGAWQGRAGGVPERWLGARRGVRCRSFVLLLKADPLCRGTEMSPGPRGVPEGRALRGRSRVARGCLTVEPLAGAVPLLGDPHLHPAPHGARLLAPVEEEGLELLRRAADHRPHGDAALACAHSPR